jgi:hypothetical protein
VIGVEDFHVGSFGEKSGKMFLGIFGGVYFSMLENI